MSTQPATIESSVTLHNGVEMPWLGLGTWQSAEGDEVRNAVTAALDLGYRHIDTASIYANEAGVGRAIAEHSVPRDEVFVTTKIWVDAIREGRDAVAAAMDASLERLGMDYVDLVLLHWPVGKPGEAWAALEDAYDGGKARAIGVSNFMVHHLEPLLAEVRIVPMVNQYEFHPWLQQPQLQAFCQARQIVPEAYAPLMRGRTDEVPELREIAKAHGKTSAQVVLRWEIQRGFVTIPKSVRRQRIEENAQIFDFELSDAEVRTIDGLDANHRLLTDPDNVPF